MKPLASELEKTLETVHQSCVCVCWERCHYVNGANAVIFFSFNKHREAAMERNRVVVRVPASSANMGPGFDCLGMALSIWSEVTMERADK